MAMKIMASETSKALIVLMPSRVRSSRVSRKRRPRLSAFHRIGCLAMPGGHASRLRLGQPRCPSLRPSEHLGEHVAGAEGDVVQSDG